MKKIGKFLLTGLLSLCFLTGCNTGGSDKSSKTPLPSMIEDVVIESIEITKMPNKLVYEEFETFDPTGMEVTANLSDGTTRVLDPSEYIVRPSGPLTASNSFVTVIDKEYDNEARFSITVNAGVEITTDPQVWVEAENAEIVTSPSALTLTCANAFEFNEAASNGVILKNFGRVGNTLTMKINATAAGKVKIVGKVCKRPKNTVSFAEMYTVMVNNAPYAVDATLDAAASGDYFDLTEMSGFIFLQEGLNNVTIQALNDTGANLDAFGFASNTATLTDAGTTATITHKDEGWYVKTNPTETTKGAYTNGCKVCGYGSTGVKELPELNETDYDVDADGVYSITVPEGATFTFGSKIYRFECEDMILGGVVSAGEHKGQPANVEDNVIAQDNASGGKCLRNMNANGNTITLNVDSSRDDKAEVSVCVAARVNNKGVAFTVPFCEMYRFDVNGVTLENTVEVVPSVGNNKQLGTYYEFHVVILGDCQLKAGKNTIVLTAVPRNDANHTMSAGNLDYVEFATNGAKLTASAN